MSLRLTEDYKWESVKCDKQAATFAICQFHLDKGNNSPAIEKHGKTSRFSPISSLMETILLHIRQGFPRFSPVLDISVLYEGRRFLTC